MGLAGRKHRPSRKEGTPNGMRDGKGISCVISLVFVRPAHKNQAGLIRRKPGRQAGGSASAPETRKEKRNGLESPKGVTLKEPTWENVEVGERFGPVEIVIDDHRIKSYAYAINDYHPWYFGDSPFGGRIGHATLLSNPLLAIYVLKYNRDNVAGLHARKSWRCSVR